MRARYGIAIAAFLVPMLPVFAGAAEKITFGTISDPGYEAAVWALANGKVKDPNLDVTVETMPIPRLVQATMTRQFNVATNGVLAIPLMAQAGISAKILATAYRYNPKGHALDIWVMKNSPYQKITDLKGKKIATNSLESQAAVSIRGIMSERYGMNPSTIGGDVQWIQLPNPQLEPALQSGNVDAAIIGNVQAYTAAKKGDYRSILQGSVELEQMYGGPMPSVMVIAYTDDLERRPAAYEAFAKLLKASAEYVQSNPDEVFASVAPKFKMEPADMKVWFTTYGSIPFSMSKSDKPVVMKAWKAGAKLGSLETVPNSVDDLVWSRAVIE